MTKFCLLSDTHMSHNEIDIPKVDYLIHCGDFSNTGRSDELEGFNEWIAGLKRSGTIKKAIVSVGNHELTFERFPDAAMECVPDVDYLLINEGLEIDGLKIWACPYVPSFFNWAFMKDEDDLYWIYNNIPVNLDILICHGPPRGYCDWNGREHVGSVSMKEVLPYKNPRYYLCGHIHHQQGVMKFGDTTIINCANMDKNYISTPPIVLEI